MATSVFQRMHDRLFSRLGEQAFLRANEPCVVNIEYGVVVNYESGDDKFAMSEFAATVDVANILNKNNPVVGSTLTVGTKQYILDAIASDNGYMSRWILRGA